MKTLNLTMAIIYTVFYSLLFLSGLVEDDFELILGVILISGPVVANWITWSNLKSQ